MSGINRYYYLEKKRRGPSIAKEAHIMEILDLFMKKYHIDFNPYEEKVIELFKENIGTMVAKFIVQIAMKGQILHVKVSLPAIKAELLMVRDAMRDNINNKIGKQVLKSIIIK